MTSDTAEGRVPARSAAGWGPWQLDPGRRVLWTGAGGYRYEVDLDDGRHPAQVLDWICQVAGMSWDGAAHDAVVAGLVRAVCDVLVPQANLCSWGHARRLSMLQVRALVERWDEEGE